jgi:hypothetical protein
LQGDKPGQKVSEIPRQQNKQTNKKPKQLEVMCVPIIPATWEA